MTQETQKYRQRARVKKKRFSLRLESSRLLPKYVCYVTEQRNIIQNDSIKILSFRFKMEDLGHDVGNVIPYIIYPHYVVTWKGKPK